MTLPGTSIFFITAIAILGMLVGSFLNVVIVRLPQMVFGNTTNTLWFPASHCPNCQHSIRLHDNIPLLSYCILRGRCRDCEKKISRQYPLVEILAASLSALIAFHFGMTWQSLFALIFTWILIALAFIDFQHLILPDQLTIGGIWLGLISSLFSIFQTPSEAIIGAICGYFSLFSVYWIFKKITSKEGLGYGDFKLLAMLGTFLGWQLLPFVLLIASLLGSMIGFIVIFYLKQDKNTPIPFGPFLCFAGFISLLYGDQWLKLYLLF